MAQSDKPHTLAAKTKAKPARKRRRKSKAMPPYHVVLLNDDEHTYAYVIEMLRSLFAHSDQRAMQMAKEVDTTGRVIVFTTHKELAELKRDQIHAWGTDWRIDSCQGSMSAVIEPARE